MKTATRIGRQWRSRIAKGGIILGYHRVTELADDPYQLCVSPANFAAQMALLHEHMQPLPLAELVERALSGALPERAVAVTFDDGYADNLYEALPVLARYRIPATLFAASGSLSAEFWWDELARLVRYRPPAFWKSLAPQLKSGQLRDLYRWLLTLPDLERRTKLDQLWQSAGGKRRGPVLTLTPKELNLLAASEWLEIGSHSVTHPCLDALAPAEQAREISDSQSALESIVGKPVRSFSYPNGCYNHQTISLVQQSGYMLACTSESDAVWTHSSRMALPRVWARNAPAAEFSDKWIRVSAKPGSSEMKVVVP